MIVPSISNPLQSQIASVMDASPSSAFQHEPLVCILPSTSESETVSIASPPVGSDGVGGSVVMTWASGSTSSVTTGTNVPPDNKLDSATLSAQIAEFNRYQDTRMISRPTTFTFSPLSFNSMLLLPPENATDTRPILHVSVGMNCFNPSSYVTTVRRGGTESGEWIGEFEMGISAAGGTVTYKNITKNINSILSKDGSKQSQNCAWRYQLSAQSPIIMWRWDGKTMNCFNTRPGTKESHQLASFTGTPLFQARVDGRRSPPPTLKLWPEGYERNMVGHVVLSALIIERKRLCPATNDTKHLFS